MAIDVVTFTVHLRRTALPGYGEGICATHIRKSLEAGGGDTRGHPFHAKDYGPILRRNGYRIVAKVTEEFRLLRVGDIAVIEPPSRGKISGHVQAWDGRNWISDFLQKDFWPGKFYREEQPDYAIYRYL